MQTFLTPINSQMYMTKPKQVQKNSQKILWKLLCNYALFYMQGVGIFTEITVHENWGCVADEIISTIFVLIRWNACFNFWTLTMKVRWKWKRKCKWREKDSATADVKAPVCLHASPNADPIQMLTFVLCHLIFYLGTTDSDPDKSFIPSWCDRNLS